MKDGGALDRWLPEYRHNEVHETVIAAPLEEVRRAVRGVRGREIPYARPLFFLRALPARLLGRPFPDRDHDRPILDVALANGFILLSNEPDAVVLGVVGRFWKLSSAIVRLAGPQEFLEFQEEGYAKAAMDFTLIPLEDGRVRVRTETRILPLGPEAARRFGLYWSIVHPGSATLRRMWLRAIRRRASPLP